MVDGLVGDALDTPNAGRQKRRFCRQMDGNLGQIAAECVFDREIADDWHGVLVKRDVDVVRRGAGNFQSSAHRFLNLSSLKHILPL